MRRGIALLAGLFLGGASQAAENWPQFRGPDGQGHADDANLPLTWSETQNVTWRTPIPGAGWSSPVIWGDQVWMTAGSKGGLSLRAVCVDKAAGRVAHDVEVFARREPMKINAKNSHASPTPVIEKGRVYVSFGTAGTACLASDSGQVLWRNEELKLDHMEGPGSSPILYKDLLVLPCDGIDVQYVAALHKDTGKLAWKATRSGKLRSAIDQRKAYSTALPVNVDGQDQLIIPGADWVYGYEPATGKEIWRAGYFGFSTAPGPVTGHGLVYVCTGFTRSELWAIRLGVRGDATQSHVAWRYTKIAPLKPSPVLVGDEIYFVNDTGIATCLDARSGQELWKQRLGGNFSASPIAAGGRIYFFSEEGKTSVVAAGKEFKLLATNDLKEYTMASPAVSGDALFLRTEKALYRIEQTGR